MESAPSFKQLRLRRPDRGVVRGLELAAGQQALWYRGPRVVTCVGHGVEAAELVETSAALEAPLVAEALPIVEDQPGASALREYERRHRRREEHARAKLGLLGGILARVIEEPQSTKAWKQGARGEARAGARLAKHLEGTSVRVLHDRRLPGKAKANIDDLAVGPGGITVIDTKNYRGKVRVERVGGLFSERRTVLNITGRDLTRLIAGVETQISAVRAALSRADQAEVEIRGALCFANVDGLPLLRHQTMREILVDGSRAAAQLARRPGPLDTETIVKLWRHLGSVFAQA